MEALGILAFFVLLIAGIVGIVCFFGGAIEEDGKVFALGIFLMLLSAGLTYTEFSVSKTKDTLILINQENVSKKDGIYSIKFYDGSDMMYNTSTYNDVQLLNDMSGNDVCIKISRDYDMYGAKFEGYRAVVSPCRENENLTVSPKDNF